MFWESFLEIFMFFFNFFAKPRVPAACCKTDLATSSHGTAAAYIKKFLTKSFNFESWSWAKSPVILRLYDGQWNLFAEANLSKSWFLNLRPTVFAKITHFSISGLKCFSKSPFGLFSILLSNIKLQQIASTGILLDWWVLLKPPHF